MAGKRKPEPPGEQQIAADVRSGITQTARPTGELLEPLES